MPTYAHKVMDFIIEDVISMRKKLLHMIASILMYKMLEVSWCKKTITVSFGWPIKLALFSVSLGHW